MFYAWRLVKRKRLFNTNKFCMDSEKTGAKVVFCSRISERIFIGAGNKPPQNTPYEVVSAQGLNTQDFTVFLLQPVVPLNMHAFPILLSIIPA